jgi:hypothetical protein
VSIPTHEEHEDAKATLAFIRQTMESASSFTAVSGWGLVGVGVVGLAASTAAYQLGDPTTLRVWIPSATLAVAIAAISNAGKAKRTGVPLWSGSFRKLAWVMAPVLAAGAVLTYALDQAGDAALLPGMWLALYGAGVTAGGTLSVRAIRGMGLAMLALGVAALLHPAWGPVLLAAGFGAVHLVFGFRLVTRHGG